MGESMVLRRSFYSPALNAEKNYVIYLPPSYRERPDLRYSTVYLLPGLFDYDMTWTEKGRVHEHMDHLIYSGKIGEMIIVMPDKDNVVFEPRTHHMFADYLANDVVGHIDYEFRTIPARTHRGIEGLSMGGSWAVKMGVKYPELYSSVSSLSGGFEGWVYNMIKENLHYYHQLGMRFRLGAGSWEPESVEMNEPFARFLRDLGFYCEFEVSEGPHEWPLWRNQIYNSLQFHYSTFNQ